MDIISQDEDAQDKAVLIIKQGLVDRPFVADPEINLASVMIKLARLLQMGKKHPKKRYFRVRYVIKKDKKFDEFVELSQKENRSWQDAGIHCGA